MNKAQTTQLALVAQRNEITPLYPNLPKETLIDGDLADWITQILDGTLAYNEKLGWLRWTGKVWEPKSVAHVRKIVLDTFKLMRKVAKTQGVPEDFRLKIKKLRSNAKVKAVTELMQSTCEVEEIFFKERLDFINAQNGIVDLRTGQILPHDKAFRCRKITRVDYVPGSTHPDWEQGLTALSNREARWLQEITGQAITGYASPEDKVNVLPGTSQNGKSVYVNGVTAALGDYVVHATEKALVSSRWDHPTEKMQVFGARVVFIEELPEEAQIDGKRLKDMTGRTMAARAIGKDNINWISTHTIFVTTNYKVQMSGNDMSVMRRVRLIPFRKVYTQNPKPGELKVDMGLKPRIEEGLDGQHEAVLAWAVEGAARWFRNKRQISAPPATIEDYNKAWRKEADHFGNFFRDHIIFDESSHVVFAELVGSYNWILKSKGLPECSARDFASMFSKRSPLAKRLKKTGRSRTVDGRSVTSFPIDKNQARQPECWFGLRFSDKSVRGVHPL